MESIVFEIFQNKNNITYCGQFYANDEKSGSALWLDLLNDGELDKNRCMFNYIHGLTMHLVLFVVEYCGRM